MYNLHTTNLFEKKKLLLTIAIGALLLFYIVSYSYVFYTYPYQAGGDALFHAWFSEQVSVTGSPPKTMPTSDTLGLYSFTPLFHITTSSFALITGLSITDTITLLNIVLIVCFILLLYSIAKLILKNSIGALLSVLIVFVINAQFSLFYFLPRNLSILFFLLALYILILAFTKNSIRLSQYVLIGLFTGSLLFTHLLNAAYAITILSTICLILYLFSDKKKVSLALLISIIVATLLFGLINVSALLGQTFPIDSSDPSFVIKASTDTSSVVVPSLTSYIPLLFLVLFIIGIISLYRTTKVSNTTFKFYIVITWIIISFLILYQIAGGYDYLASRALTLLLPIFAIVAAWGLVVLMQYLIRKNKTLTFIVPLIIILLTLFPLTKQSLSGKSQQIKYGLTHEHIQTIESIKDTLPSGTILSDPTTMYLLTTLGNMSPAYQFEHTNLTRQRFIRWNNVQQLFMQSTEDSELLISELNPDYIVISSNTKKLFPNADYSMYEQEQFTKVFTSNLTASTSDPEYVFYELVQ